MNDKFPLEVEVEAAVRHLRPHRAVRHTHLRVKDFKKWQREAYPGDQSKTPPTEGALAVSGRHCIANLVHRGDPKGVGMDFPGTNPKRDHHHMSHWPAKDPVDGGGGADRHPY